jgi:hypothetical protein
MKIIAGAALLALVTSSAQAGGKDITYEFKLLSETERLADGTVEVVAIPPKDIFATLVLTHEAVKEHEATLTVQTFYPQSMVNMGVVSFAANASSTPAVSDTFNYPFVKSASDGRASMDLEIVDGELSGSIQVDVAFGHGAVCDLSMQGTDGNWSGQWSCSTSLPEPLFAFTAIPFRVEPGHEHDHDKDKVADRR